MRHALICQIAACMAAVLALAGCGKKEAAPAAAGSATPASATAPAASTPSLLPTTPPERKAGLWEQTISSDQMHQTMTLCLDDTVSKSMSWRHAQANAKTNCSQESITPRLGGGWEFSSVCATPSGTISSKGVASGDFGSHYTVDVDSTTTGSPMPQANGLHKIRMEGTWKGACPAGMRPGDMVLPGGMKINTVDMMNGKSPDYGHMSHADIAKLRAQGAAMAAAMKKEQ